MSCEYLIKLRNGDTIKIPTSLEENNYTESDFRNSLHKLGQDILLEIKEKIENSDNKPLEISSLNLKNVIKTTSLQNIRNFNSNIYYNDPVTASLYDHSKKLIDLIESVGGNKELKTTSIIYTDTQDKFNPNYGNAYDLDSNTFIINSNKIGDINFIALNKGLIDMYILKYSPTLQTLIKSQFNDVQNFIENMPFLYRNGKINYNIIEGIKQELNISNDIFNYIYNFHSEAQKRIVYEGKTSTDMKLFANYISDTFGILQNSENRKYYYSDTQTSDTYPILNAGDLIKVKTEFKNGEFGLYLDHYTVDNKRHYMILFPRKNGNIYKSFNEDELKFNNQFYYQTNVISDSVEGIQFDEKTPLNNIEERTFIDLRDSSYDNLEIKRIPENLLKLLKKGDKFGYEYIDKKTNESKRILKEVIGINGNTILYRDNKINSKLNKSLIGGKLFVSSVIFDLKNHPEFNEFDSKKFREKRIKDKLSFPIDKNFKEMSNNEKNNIFSQLSTGDIILSKMPGSDAVYHNYYIGEIEDNVIVLVRNNGNLRITSIKKSNVENVIYDISDKKELIHNYNLYKNSIDRSFDIDILTSDNRKLKGNDESIEDNNRYSVYSVNNTSKISDTLKQEINSGDYVKINKINYLVLENNDGKLKLYNNGELTTNIISNVDKILKIKFTPDQYSQKILQMNTRLLGTIVNLNDLFKNISHELVHSRYVIDKTFANNYKWTGGFVKQGYIVDDNYYNGNREITDKDGNTILIPRKNVLLDLSREYAEQNLERSEEGDALYSVKINGAYANNTSGTTRYDIHNMPINEAVKLLSIGSYITIHKLHRTFRVEEILDDKLILSFIYSDSNGNLTKMIDSVDLNILDNGKENKIYSLFIPNVQTIMNDKLKNYKEQINKSNNSISENIGVTEDDSVEILNMISNYLENKFNVKTVIGTTNDFKSNEELNGVSQLDSAKAFIKNGIIYINSDNATISDPIHEISHLITGTLKIINPKLYEDLLKSIKYDDNILKEKQQNYPGLTYYELLEETFAEQFAKNITGQLNTNEFNDDNFLDIINKITNEIFQLSEESDDTEKLLTTPIYQLINEFGSNFITNPEFLYDRNASLLANEITLAKEELMKSKDNLLKEMCK